MWNGRAMRAGHCVGLLLAALCAAGMARADTPVELINPGMEAPYNPANPDNTATSGLVSGVIANGWSDNSAWAGATVQYSQETANPHSGSSCQKVVVTSVGTGPVQFIQAIQLPAGNLYTA